MKAIVQKITKTRLFVQKITNNSLLRMIINYFCNYLKIKYLTGLNNFFTKSLQFIGIVSVSLQYVRKTAIVSKLN